ncbi:MAG: hypothetical protein F9K44_11200 [Hyphomicrobiaceae bacterium]|jgi:hypothetical protein|nr:MAG: hypothetical protein F9K44_11200 [Hyphomicrobiaceae bacterium]
MRNLIRHSPPAIGFALLAIVALVAPAAPALAVLCTVGNGTYPTIESAVRDANCQPISVPAGTYRENFTVSRPVSIFGAGTTTTTIQGRVAVVGAGTDVVFDGFAVRGGAANVSGCWTSIVNVGNGATLDSIALDASNQNVSAGDCRIFEDGFDFGSVNAWSSAID